MTTKDKQQTLTITPRDAAIEFIRPYVLKGDMMPLMPHKWLRIDTENYTAQIEKNSVVVSKLNGSEIKESFPLKEVMKAIVEEHRKTFNFDNSAKAAFRQKEREVNALIEQLLEKLKAHRQQFRQNLFDWSFVGNLTHISEVLESIV